MKTAEMCRKASVVAVIIVPFVATVWAIYKAVTEGVTAVSLGLFATMYVLTILGVTVGWHRYFTHKGFTMSRPLVYFFGIFGAMAIEGTLIDWVSQHCTHHRHTDREGDPHSPVARRPVGLWQRATGMLHAHCLWMVSMDGERDRKLIADLLEDPVAVRINKYTSLWIVLGLALPTLVGWCVGGSRGALDGFLWGGLVRIFAVHQVTWSVNSICHLFGTEPYFSLDNSQNNWLVGVLALGEGYHNAHHAFERSARHGLRWWEIDVSWYVICLLEFLGYVSNIQTISPEQFKKNRERKERFKK